MFAAPPGTRTKDIPSAPTVRGTPQVFGFITPTVFLSVSMSKTKPTRGSGSAATAGLSAADAFR
ncbi:hypothetical protein DDJ31_01940 [Streptomyces griseoviridis]|uniref:Uncharacterized protein n=1 Tax=Streptomyces griseoviridis TaxID=45398 RepID=A0ABX5TQQ4_STRGD|nr:hypothetical protein DDJ31_01940 [Streptomyces griseoviridis]